MDMNDASALGVKVAALEARLVSALAANRAAQQTIAELNDQITQVKEYFARLTYNSDGFTTERINTDFLKDERFVAAYQRSMASGHQIRLQHSTGSDLHIEWRVAIACWAARHAAHLPGDFVECGTNTGILALAICDYVGFNDTGKSFFLFDTFEGIPLDQLSSNENLDNKKAMNEQWYPDCFETTRRNFQPYPRVQLVRGRIPESLAAIDIEKVSYLSIDMNIAYPERAALEHFWPRLVTGGIVVFDDYSFLGHEPQKSTHDEFARTQGVEIFTLPTGQGILLKP
jgi:O-methyltransferase